MAVVPMEELNRTQSAASTIVSEHGTFLTVADLTEILKVSRFVIDRMLKTGQLPAAKIGGQYRVRSDDFTKWWNAQVKQEQKKLLKDCLPR